jgi:hypothetical protein
MEMHPPGGSPWFAAMALTYFGGIAHGSRPS